MRKGNMLHHLRCVKPYELWDADWCRFLTIHTLQQQAFCSGFWPCRSTNLRAELTGTPRFVSARWRADFEHGEKYPPERPNRIRRCPLTGVGFLFEQLRSTVTATCEGRQKSKPRDPCLLVLAKNIGTVNCSQTLEAMSFCSCPILPTKNTQNPTT